MRKTRGFIFLIFLMLGCREEVFEIVSIDPRIGKMGDVLTIRGSGFGNERNESYITIAGTPPTNSSYLSWKNNEITVRIPEFGEAGLVYVHREGRKSSPALFANQQALPEPVPDEGSFPRVASVLPVSGAIGSLITIQGSNFGPSRENSGVFFPWDSQDSGIEALIEVSEAEFGYEFWSEREIRVRLPDGAASGNLIVRTQSGDSQPVYFEISGKPGTKTLKDKRTYNLSHGAEILIQSASAPNALYVWIPQPVPSASQRNLQMLSRSTEPFMENFRGASLFQFINTTVESNLELKQSCLTEVYTVETNIRNLNPVRLNERSQAGSFYVLPSALVPSDDPAVKASAAEIAGRERLPYTIAQRIYQWLISSLEIKAYPLSGGALDALEGKEADSYSASLLFCALARASGIPAIPVAGVLVDGKMNSPKHFWAEFWLDGFGWIPVDPALGAGAAPGEFILTEGNAAYYFGNLDNSHIAFSRGEPFMLQMNPAGQTVQRDREYSLQNLWEEASGGLESYSSIWSDVTITGMYAQ